MIAIEVKNMTKSYNDRTILCNFSLKVKVGEMIALVGESGAGKTTLLNCLGLLENPNSGDIYYFGERVVKRKVPYFYEKYLGFLFQNFALIENETVFENLKLVSKSMDRISELMERFHLSLDYLNQKVYQLSGGEQQRVAFIRTLLKDPQILLADEPTASLDRKNSLFILESLRKEKEKGKTIVVVTHDVSILPYFDRVLEVKDGQLNLL